MALRSALGLLEGSLGVLGITRTCSGASTSGQAHRAWNLVGAMLVGGPTTASAVDATAATLGATAAWGHSLPGGLLASSVRGYRSNKRSLKPLNTAASWQAVEPLLEQERQKQEALGAPAAESPLRRRLRPRLGPIVDTCLPPIPAVPLPAEYTRVGAITGQYALRPEGTFAVVQLSGTQYKVTTDDIVFTNLLHGVSVNDVVALDRVMLLGSRSETIVGRPYVPGATVLAAVEEHFRDGKVHVFKKKRKKRYQKYQATRPHLTTLRILQVRGMDAASGNRVALLPEVPVEWDVRFKAQQGVFDDEGQQQQIAVGAAAVGTG